MPAGTSTADGRPVRLLPVTMPGPVVPPLGDWHARGLCTGEDPDAFFPSNGAPGTRAREVCAACPVCRDCLQYATAADESGIWGGLDQQERRNLKRKHRRRETRDTDKTTGRRSAEGVA
jgi:WhiB family transcriptional regulator, redox-sensing transcriptional regulator